MNRWVSLVSEFGMKFARSAQARHRLNQAYTAVFETGKSSEQDRQMVLADLLSKSGFATVTHHSANGDELRQREGMRQLYATTIHEHLSLSSEQRQALTEAARQEFAADVEATNNEPY